MGRNTDKHSVCGDPQFIDPKNGDFRVKAGSPALLVGFKNFDMTNFGVVSPNLKLIAKKPTLPEVLNLSNTNKDEAIDFSGAKIKNLNTLGERSANGMADIYGVLVLNVSQGGKLSDYLQPNDVIISFNRRKVMNIRDLMGACMFVIGSNCELVVFRNQKELKRIITLK
jgi:hypothetical protein